MSSRRIGVGWLLFLLGIGVSVGIGVSAAATSAPRDAGWQRSRSVFATLPVAVPVAAPVRLFSSTVNLSAPDSVFVESDGVAAPSGPSAIRLEIRIDGARVSNTSPIDWWSSSDAKPRSFDVVGSTWLSVGRHRVTLLASPDMGWTCTGRDGCTSPAGTGPSRVLAGAGLAVLVHPARQITVKTLANDSPEFSFTTYELIDAANVFHGPLPHQPLLSTIITGPTFALASGWAYASSNGCDALLGFFVDGTYAGNGSASWANQDLCVCAEPRGPLYAQAFVSGSHVLSLDASESHGLCRCRRIRSGTAWQTGRS